MFGGIAIRTNFDERRRTTDRFFKNANNDVDKSLKSRVGKNPKIQILLFWVFVGFLFLKVIKCVRR